MPPIESATVASARRGPSPRLKLLLTLLSPLAGVALGLVALELHLRRTSAHLLGNPTASHGMYRIESPGHFSLTPGWSGEHLVEGRTVPVTIDGDGVRADRADRRAGPREPRERRVLFLGDSLVFGYGVTFEESFANVLELGLEARTGTPWSVFNAGTPGHGTWELPRQLDRYAHLDPDLILAGTSVANDFTDDCFLENDVVAGYLISGPMAGVSRSSWRVRTALNWRVALLIEKQLAHRAPSLSIDLTPVDDVKAPALDRFPPRAAWLGGLYADRIERDGLIEQILATCESNYRELYARAGETPVLHVFFPSDRHADPVVWSALLDRLGFDPADHRRGRMIERLEELVASLGRRSVDVLEWVDTAGMGSTDQWFETDNHFSPIGNRDVGERLVAPVLAALGLED